MSTKQSTIFGTEEPVRGNVHSQLFALLDERQELTATPPLALAELMRSWGSGVAVGHDTIIIRKDELAELLRLAPLVERYIREYKEKFE